MKKIIPLGILCIFLLIGCDEQSKLENNSTTKETSNSEETSNAEKNAAVDFEKVMIENIGSEDKLKDYSIKDGLISATIELAKSDLLKPYLLAENCYSTLGDALLPLEGWDTLTIQFEGIGEVSFDRSESEKNDYGPYFPTAKIIDKVAAAK